MVHSTATTVDSYLETVPNARRDSLERLRASCLTVLMGYEESMSYGMPSYNRPGQAVEVAFASQARYISIYILRQTVLDEHRDKLVTANLGKGCVRYSTPSKIDFDTVTAILRQTTIDDGPIC